MAEKYLRLLVIATCLVFASGCKRVESPADVLPPLEQIQAIKADFNLPAMAVLPSFDVPPTHFSKVLEPLLKAKLSQGGLPSEVVGSLEIKSKGGQITRIELFAPDEVLTIYSVTPKKGDPYVFNNLVGLDLCNALITAWGETHHPQ